MSGLTDRQHGHLLTVRWGEQHFDGLCAGGDVRTRDLRALERRGFVRCIGFMPVADGDGWTKQPERERRAYVLTEAGRAVIACRDCGSLDHDTGTCHPREVER